MGKTFGIDPPRLSWLGGKLSYTSLGDRKNRPGRKEEHADANVENGLGHRARRELQVAMEKAAGLLDPATVEGR